MLSKFHPRFIGAVMDDRYPADMHHSLAAAILCLSLVLAAAGFAADSSAPRDRAPAAAGEAAKHAKRTACLKDAKAKKLVGADKTAFLKRCIDAP